MDRADAFPGGDHQWHEGERALHRDPLGHPRSSQHSRGQYNADPGVREPPLPAGLMRTTLSTEKFHPQWKPTPVVNPCSVNACPKPSYAAGRCWRHYIIEYRAAHGLPFIDPAIGPV